MSISLTLEERKKFAQYCMEQAIRLQKIAKQMQKMSAPNIITSRMSGNAGAFIIVAQILQTMKE